MNKKIYKAIKRGRRRTMKTLKRSDVIKDEFIIDKATKDNFDKLESYQSAAIEYNNSHDDSEMIIVITDSNKCHNEFGSNNRFKNVIVKIKYK